MKNPKLDEIRHLRPHIRLAMLEGRVRYKGQEKPVEIDDEATKKLKYSGQLEARGGRSEAANDPRLFVHDTLVRAPHITSQN